jgi:hypothetical protein
MKGRYGGTLDTSPRYDDTVARTSSFVKRSERSFLQLGSYEALWDPNERVWLEAGAFGSTYNYVCPRGFFTGIGHFVFDVVPFWLCGTDRGRKHRSLFGLVTGK